MFEKEQVIELLGKQMERLSEYSHGVYIPEHISNISLAMKNIAEVILNYNSVCNENHPQD